MLLSSVIISLREVLEAALLFSVLLALTRQSGFNPRWVAWSILTGSIGACIYALNIDIISEWFEGVGQEIINAMMLISMYFLLVLYLFFFLRLINQKQLSKTGFVFLMVAISTLAITREGSELILYFISITHSENNYMAAIIGMTIGASIGLSMGLIFYYFLVNIKKKRAVYISLFLLLLVAAGMVSQASMSLIQADWLAAQLPIWDTSDWLSERSVPGQLLYAVIGYEATPTAIQFSWYLSGLILPIIFLTVLQIKYVKEEKLLSDDIDE